MTHNHDFSAAKSLRLCAAAAVSNSCLSETRATCLIGSQPATAGWRPVIKQLKNKHIPGSIRARPFGMPIAPVTEVGVTLSRRPFGGGCRRRDRLRIGSCGHGMASAAGAGKTRGKKA